MKKILYIFTAAILLASCDKIDDIGGYYVTFSGATGEWIEDFGVEDHSQRVFVEKYTGTHCNNCPKADVAIKQLQDKYGQQLIATSVYDSSNYGMPYPGSRDLRTADGNTWSKYFNIRTMGYPNCLLNRSKDGSGNYEIINPTSGLDNKIDAILAKPTAVAIEVDCAGVEGRQVLADVRLEFLQNISESLTITLLLIEDGLISEQMLPIGSETESDPDYVHDHVLRDVITDPWGEVLGLKTQAGKSYRARYSFEIDSDCNIDNCHVVAFISYQDSRVILNSAECELGE